MKISVLVLSYNSKIEKLFLTLKSIVMQDFDDFEIVIADDGSKNPPFRDLDSFFETYAFKNYHYVANTVNRGTVKNIISGLSCCTGKYVKPISAGDCLYNENTLKNVYTFMEKEKAECCFGLIQGYRTGEDGSFSKTGYYHPFDIKAYRLNQAEKRITRNLLLYSDNVCGAAICYRKDFFVEYMKKIEPYVVYEEDIFQVLSAVEGRCVKLYDSYMIWYEIGNGISTKKHTRFEELLAKDVDALYRHLYELYPENRYVKKRHALLPFYRIKNLYLRTILRTFVNPDAIRYLISSFVQKRMGAHRQKENVEMGFLENPEFKGVNI